MAEAFTLPAVPNGGYITSCFLSVAKLHFSTTLCSLKQPHTLTLHLEFLRRTETGPATFVVKDAKLGQRTSTIHVTLIQGDGREEVAGYIIHSDLTAKTGVSVPTTWTLHPAPPEVDLNELRRDLDPNWKLKSQMPFSEFRKASRNVDFFFPRSSRTGKGTVEQWMRLKGNQTFVDTSLGLVADMFPQLVEPFDPEELGLEGRLTKPPFWYPTLVLNLEVKKLLPARGTEFLYVRISTKGVENGRFDIEVIIMDETGDIVAVSHHVSMILSIDRNMAARRQRQVPVPDKSMLRNKI